MDLWRPIPGMRARWLATPALAMLLAGCQTGNQTALEGELRMRAEENTQLKLIIHDLEVDLREAERKLERAERTSGNGNGAAAKANGSGTKPMPPDIELGPPKQNDDEPAPAPRFNPQGQRRPAGDQSSRTRTRDQRIAKITLDPKQTTGWDADPETPGDEGLLVVVEPRNAAGELAPVAGQIAIAAYDAELLEQHKGSARRGELAHVGTWHFNPEDARTWFLQDEDGEKMHFELRWPEDRPAGSQVRVYVRYITPDGRTLQSNWSVAVQHDGTRSQDVADAEASADDVATPGGAASASASPPWHSALRGDSSRAPEWKPYR